ncbi:MAG: hydrogenase maturation nickel metallochaperone HypA [Thauera sp.]
MHEMSLAENVREIIEDAARTQGFRRVSRVVLEIGELAAVETDALRFCLDVVLEGSVAAGAAIEWVTVPGIGWCARCAQDVPLHERYDPCPHCGAYGLEVRSGERMRVSTLDVA